MTSPLSRSIELGTGLGCHLLEWGSDRADLEHTVVLVHGFLDLCWSWEETVRAGLAERYHVVAPDVRGHGDSDRIGGGGYYYFMDYVADLASLIEQVGRKRLSLVGHSMGGSIVSYFAGAFPARVHRLALLEGTGPPEDPTPAPERLASFVHAASRARRRPPRRYASVADAAHRLMAHDPLLDRQRALRLGEVGTRELPDGGRAFKHDPLHLTRGPYPFRLDVAVSFWERITAPVLLVQGSESNFRHTGDEAKVRERVFSGARNAVLAGAAHMMQRHQPQALARLLLDFLE
jgi:pimeloyl-ACP methyl ester carboxylesterase